MSDEEPEDLSGSDWENGSEAETDSSSDTTPETDMEPSDESDTDSIPDLVQGALVIDRQLSHFRGRCVVAHQFVVPKIFKKQ